MGSKIVPPILRRAILEDIPAIAFAGIRLICERGKGAFVKVKRVQVSPIAID